MPCWFETVTDLADDRQRDVVRRRRYGVIEMGDGRLLRLSFRPLPTVAGPFDLPLGWTLHRLAKGNRCWLYFNQPRGLEQFLALKFVVSTRHATLATFHGALDVLDEVARIKQVDAIVCDAANWRISDRLLTRWDWVPHKPQRWHRNYIKRFPANTSVAHGGLTNDDPFGGASQPAQQGTENSAKSRKLGDESIRLEPAIAAANVSPLQDISRQHLFARD